MSETTTLVPRDVGASFSLRATTMAEAIQFATLIAKSDLAPKDYRAKPENCLVAIQMGAELGLSPMQALQNIAVINGRPAVWGDAVLAICQASPDFEDCIETGNGTLATCTVKRRGRAEITRIFSIEDAKKAGLWGKQGPWTQYPDRMLQMRARAFALRDAYADRLRGIGVAEEVRDIPRDVPREPQRVGASTLRVEAPPPAVMPDNADPSPSSTMAAVVPSEASAAGPRPKRPADPLPKEIIPSIARGVSILDTSYVSASKTMGAHHDIETSEGQFSTTDDQLASEAASCAGTDHKFALTWKPSKSRSGKTVRLLLALDLDEGERGADVQTGLPL